MKTTKKIGALMVAFALSSPAFAVTHTEKTIGALLPPGSGGNDCVFFTLHGVPIADPVNSGSGSAWLSLPRTHVGFKEIYALLLTARTTGMPLTIVTTGAIGCGGYVGLQYLYAPH